MKNKHGLDRNIPADVKLAVRQACGFGCVICGLNITDYDHVDPPFAEAKQHVANAIALLCPRCHAKITRGFMAKDTIKEARQKPICKQQGYASEMLALGKTNPKIVFGGVTILNCPIPIQVLGYPLFQIEPAEQPDGPIRLSATFFNSHGNLSLQIVQNEWKALDSNWDLEVTGGKIIVRDAPGHISLQLAIKPPDEIIVEILDMRIAHYHLVANPMTLFVNGNSFTGCVMDNCRVGMALN